MMQSITELIQQRRNQILLHSYIYYQMDENVVSDLTYDKWCKELAELQIKYPEEASRADHAEAYKEFDGSSGYGLPFNTPEWNGKAVWLVRLHKERKVVGR